MTEDVFIPELLNDHCGSRDEADEVQVAPLTLEGFVAAVAAIEFDDANGGPYALNFAAVNTLHGRGSLDKVTRRTVVSAIRTLQAVIRDAQALQAVRAAQ